MPRQPRCLPPGFVYHALNRTVARGCLFEKPADYDAFERVLALAFDKHPIRILAYCLMPNHWHFVLWPQRHGQMTDFLRWLTHTHTQRWHAHYHSAGTGHLYQGRFKAFPVQEDNHLLALLRYAERNALRAGLVSQAEIWRWGSLFHRLAGDTLGKRLLSPWPVTLPADWVERVNQPETEGELEAIRRSVVRGCPYGAAGWQRQTATQMGLAHTLRRRGRPKKQEQAGE